MEPSQVIDTEVPFALSKTKAVKKKEQHEILFRICSYLEGCDLFHKIALMCRAVRK